MSSSVERIVIRAFRATEDPGTCERYLEGHRNVLAEIGITNVLSASESWCQDANTYVIVAEHAEWGMVGGLRVQVAQPQQELPMETAIASMDPRIHTIMSGLAESGNAELCGLWNAQRIAGRGLPNLLGFAAVSMANQIGIKSLVGFVAHYTLRYALKVGFEIMEDIGDSGTFSYPVPNIKSIALIIPDVITLQNAPAQYWHHLFCLRLRPDQIREERITTIPMEVVYQLLMDRKIVTLSTYRMIAQERLRHSA